MEYIAIRAVRREMMKAIGALKPSANRENLSRIDPQKYEAFNEESMVPRNMLVDMNPYIIVG